MDAYEQLEALAARHEAICEALALDLLRAYFGPQATPERYPDSWRLALEGAKEMSA